MQCLRLFHCRGQRGLQKVYIPDKSPAWNQRWLFNGSLLTGIVEEVPDETLILMWGITSFTCIPLEMLLKHDECPEDSEIVAPDWILDARAIEPTIVGLVTAQNAFLTYSTKMRTFIQRINCEQQ